MACPSKLSPQDRALAEASGRTHPRTRLDDAAARTALAVLGDPLPRRFAWLAGRYSHLAALGRIADPAVLRTVARDLCRLRPPAQDAIRYVRSRRFARDPATDLATALRTTVARVRRLHPELPPTAVATALRGLLADVMRETRADDSRTPLRTPHADRMADTTRSRRRNQ